MFLRNPIERCYSHYQMDLVKFGNDWVKQSKHGNPYSFEEIIEWEGDGENYINRGKYAIQIENLFNTFSKYNVHIAISEKCKENPFTEYKKIFEFLERPIEKYEELEEKCKKLEGIEIYSDELNHASMIQGIKNANVKVHIFRHNDTDHLEELLKTSNANTPKMIVFESLYSMEGLRSPIEKIIWLAEKYNALTIPDYFHKKYNLPVLFF